MKKQTQKQREKKVVKKKYKVRNWREYNQALVDRGKVIFWITEEALDQWEVPPEELNHRKRGAPQQFSNMAIEVCLTIQQVFRLPLRMTEGVVESLLANLKTNASAPDYSTLCLRRKTLPVTIPVRPLRQEPLHLVVDSTGVKVWGEGEWKVRQHGWSRHRTWRKLHLGIDPENGDVVMGEVTTNAVADSAVLSDLLHQLPKSVSIEQVSADGGYDKRVCYKALINRRVTTIAIPPRHGARIWQHGNTKGERHARDQNVRRIRGIGRTSWKSEIGYHRRSLAETTMFRLKKLFDDRVASRIFQNQRSELLLRVKVLNRMTALGMPQSEVVA